MPTKNYSYQQEKGKMKVPIHPIWRGVGFILIILIPIIAWAATNLLIEQGVIPLAPDLRAKADNFLYILFRDQWIIVKAISIAVISLALYMVFMFVSFLITSIVIGRPERYDPYYVPEIRRTRRKQ